MNKKLTPDDQNRLFLGYNKHRPKWRTIGMRLNIAPDYLDSIERHRHYHPDDCFSDMLGHWLRNDKMPTEEKLASAVVDLSVNDEAKLTENLNNKKPTEIGPIILLSTTNLESSNQQQRPSLCKILPSLLCIFGTIVHICSTPDLPLYILDAAQTLKFQYSKSMVIEYSSFHNIKDIQMTQKFLNVSFSDKYGDPVSLDKMLANYTGEPGCLGITGKPGSGKTTLVRHLAKEWAEERALNSCILLFFVHFDIPPQRVTGIADLLTISKHSEEPKIKQNKDKIADWISLRSTGVCFLLDGYKHGDNYYLDDVIYNSKFSSFYILTSRSPFKERDGLEQFNITGFSMEHLYDHLGQLTKNNKVADSIKLLWTRNSEVKEMCTLPLHMVMIIYITTYNSALTLPNAVETDLYFAFLNVTVIHRYPDSWDLNSLWDCVRIGSKCITFDKCCAFQTIHGVAFKMFFQNENSFSKPKGYNHTVIDSLGLVGIIPVEGSEDKIRFTFSHPTFLEFFTAIHLTTLQKDALFPYIVVYKDRSEVQKVWQFLFGMIGNYLSPLHNIHAPQDLLYHFARYTGNNYHQKEVITGKTCNVPHAVHSSVFNFAREINCTSKQYQELFQHLQSSNERIICVRHNLAVPFDILSYLSDLVKEWNWNLKVVFEAGMQETRVFRGNVSNTLSSVMHQVFYGLQDTNLLNKLVHELNSSLTIHTLQSKPGLNFNDYAYATYLTVKGDPNYMIKKIRKLPKIVRLILITTNSSTDQVPISNLLEYPENLTDLTVINGDGHNLVLQTSILRGLRHLIHLTVKNWIITESNIYNFLQILKENNHLLALNLENTFFRYHSTDSRWAYEMISELPMNLRQLYLCDIHLNDESIYELSQALQLGLPNLVSLGLVNNNISIVGFKTLVNTLNLQSIDISHNNLFAVSMKHSNMKIKRNIYYLKASVEDIAELRLLIKLINRTKQLIIEFISPEVDEDIVVSAFKELSTVQTSQVILCSSKFDSAVLWTDTMKLHVVTNAKEVDFILENTEIICFYKDPF